MQKLGLHEACDFYSGKLELYRLFSEAEDYPGLVSRYLLEQACSKRVLDAGCSFGKILAQLAPVAHSITGVDQSEIAIRQASKVLQGYKPKLDLQVARLEDFCPKTQRYDLVYASWVLGTIQSPEQRESALRNLISLTSDSGKIILIENSTGGEFEAIRGRVEEDLRTINYNNWILSQGFYLEQTIESYFKFDTLDTARAVFSEIWGTEAANRVQSPVISHPINIFVRQLKPANIIV
mgnify:CR=1 FL=1